MIIARTCFQNSIPGKCWNPQGLDGCDDISMKEQEMYLEGLKGGWKIKCGLGFWKEGKLPGSGRECLCRGDWKKGHLIIQVYAMGKNMDICVWILCLWG